MNEYRLTNSLSRPLIFGVVTALFGLFSGLTSISCLITLQAPLADKATAYWVATIIGGFMAFVMFALSFSLFRLALWRSNKQRWTIRFSAQLIQINFRSENAARLQPKTSFKSGVLTIPASQLDWIRTTTTEAQDLDAPNELYVDVSVNDAWLEEAKELRKSERDRIATISKKVNASDIQLFEDGVIRIPYDANKWPTSMIEYWSSVDYPVKTPQHERRPRTLEDAKAITKKIL